jgi:hypothetical protein
MPRFLTDLLLGIERGTRGLPQAVQAGERLGLQRKKMDEEQAKQERERKAMAAKTAWDVAVATGDPAAMQAAFPAMLEAGVLPGADPLTPENIPFESMPEVTGIAPDVVDPRLRAMMTQGAMGQEDLRLMRLRESREEARKMTAEERAVNKPLYPSKIVAGGNVSYDKNGKPTWRRIEGMPVPADGVSMIYTNLAKLDPQRRLQLFSYLPTKTREALITQYGDSLDLPMKKDPVMLRREKEAGPPLFTLDEVARYLSQDKYVSKLGPVMGLWYGKNPYDTDAQDFQSQLIISTQIVGLYLEGGVLHDKDIPKYERMLPQLTDAPAVAHRKLGNIRRLVKAKQKIYAVAGVFSEAGEITVPGLPFKISQTSPDAIEDWLNTNPTYEHGQELLEIIEARRAIEQGK